MTRVLEVRNLEGGYGAVQILYGIDLYVRKGSSSLSLGQTDAENQH